PPRAFEEMATGDERSLARQIRPRMTRQGWSGKWSRRPTNDETSWQAGRGSIGGVEEAPVLCQGHCAQPCGLGPTFFSPIIPPTHVRGTLDQILYDPLPEEVGEGQPVDLRPPVALKKRVSVRRPDEDEIALLGGQRHLIPIDHKYLARSVPDQVPCVQVAVTD